MHITENSYDTVPAECKFFKRSAVNDASSSPSLWAVCMTLFPTDKPPATILSHLPGHVCLVNDLCCSQMHKPFCGWLT